MDDFLLNVEGKLGHVFTSADELEQVDIGDESRPRLMVVSAKCKQERSIVSCSQYKRYHLSMKKFEKGT
jgi:hypothetical protein